MYINKWQVTSIIISFSPQHQQTTWVQHVKSAEQGVDAVQHHWRSLTHEKKGRSQTLQTFLLASCVCMCVCVMWHTLTVIVHYQSCSAFSHFSYIGLLFPNTRQNGSCLRELWSGKRNVCTNAYCFMCCLIFGKNNRSPKTPSRAYFGVKPEVYQTGHRKLACQTALSRMAFNWLSRRLLYLTDLHMSRFPVRSLGRGWGVDVKWKSLGI